MPLQNDQNLVKQPCQKIVKKYRQNWYFSCNIDWSFKAILLFAHELKLMKSLLNPMLMDWTVVEHLLIFQKVGHEK